MFAVLSGTIAEWKSKELSNEKIKRPFTSNHNLPRKLAWMNNSRIRLRF